MKKITIPDLIVNLESKKRVDKQAPEESLPDLYKKIGYGLALESLEECKDYIIHSVKGFEEAISICRMLIKNDRKLSKDEILESLKLFLENNEL